MVMLLWLWWGLLGFLSFLAMVYFAFAGVRERFGQRGITIVFVAIAVVVQILMVRAQGNERRNADRFLAAWEAESADFPKGRMNTNTWGMYVDYERFGDINPYLAQHLRLRYRSPIREHGNETIQPAGADSLMETKVFVSDVMVYHTEQYLHFSSRLRLWVATDNNKVVQITFEDIEY